MRSYTQNATNRTGPIAVRAATKRPSIFENFQNSPPNTHYFQDIPSHAVFRKHHQSANFLYSVPLHPSASAASSSSVCRCQPRVIPRRCPLILLHNSSSDFRVVVHLPPPPSSAVPSSVRPPPLPPSSFSASARPHVYHVVVVVIIIVRPPPPSSSGAHNPPAELRLERARCGGRMCPQLWRRTTMMMAAAADDARQVVVEAAGGRWCGRCGAGCDEGRR